MRRLSALLLQLFILSSLSRDTDGRQQLSSFSRDTDGRQQLSSFSRDTDGRQQLSSFSRDTDGSQQLSSVNRVTDGRLHMSSLYGLKDGGQYQSRNTTVKLSLSGACDRKQVRLDNFDHVELTHLVSPAQDGPIPGGATCVAHFMTGSAHQGICISSKGDFLTSPHSGLELRIYTSWLGPDKIFNSGHRNLTTWCTDSSLVSVELRATHHVIIHNTDIRFSFQLTNVSIDTIDKQYRMDTFKHCQRQISVNSGEEIRIIGLESPVLGDLPSSCELHVLTGSGDDNLVLCLRVDEYKTDKSCQSRLVVSGFDSRFWPESLVLDCNDSRSVLPSAPEMCSKAKTLTLIMTRKNPSDTGLNFALSVQAKWHPYWQVLSDQVTGRRWMDFVRGFTYFIATIDSLAGIAAAVLASMIRRPRSFWKEWAMSLNPVETCNALHYEVTFPEVSCSHMEEEDDVKS